MVTTTIIVQSFTAAPHDPHHPSNNDLDKPSSLALSAPPAEEASIPHPSPCDRPGDVPACRVSLSPQPMDENPAKRPSRQAMDNVIAEASKSAIVPAAKRSKRHASHEKINLNAKTEKSLEKKGNHALICELWTDYLQPMRQWFISRGKLDDWCFFPASLKHPKNNHVTDNAMANSNAKKLTPAKIKKEGTPGIHYADGWNALHEMIRIYGVDHAPEDLEHFPSPLSERFDVGQFLRDLSDDSSSESEDSVECDNNNQVSETASSGSSIFLSTSDESAMEDKKPSFETAAESKLLAVRSLSKEEENTKLVTSTTEQRETNNDAKAVDQEKQIKEMKKQLEGLVQRTSRLENEKNTLRERNVNLEQEKEDLIDGWREMKGQVRELNAILTDTKRKYEHINGRLRDENQALKQQLTKLMGGADGMKANSAEQIAIFHNSLDTSESEMT